MRGSLLLLPCLLPALVLAPACAVERRRGAGGGGGAEERPPAEGEGEGEDPAEGEGEGPAEGEGEGPAEGEGEGPAEGEGEGSGCEPAAEVCNGEDDDCDGRTDEDDPRLGEGCNTGLPGPCWQGRQRCQRDRKVLRERAHSRGLRGVAEGAIVGLDGFGGGCDGAIVRRDGGATGRSSRRRGRSVAQPVAGGRLGSASRALSEVERRQTTL